MKYCLIKVNHIYSSALLSWREEESQTCERPFIYDKVDSLWSRSRANDQRKQFYHSPLLLQYPIYNIEMSSGPSTSSIIHTQQITPIVPPAIHVLASPLPSLIDSQLPSYLLPSVLALLRESTGQVIRKRRKQEDELREEGLIPPLDKGKGKATDVEMDQLIETEALKKVERIGFMVGGFIAEK